MKNSLKQAQIEKYLKAYLTKRPFFLGLIRAKEAALFQNHIPFKKPVLDLGCGDGFFAEIAFSDQGKIDIGLDIDKNSLSLATKRKVYKKLRCFNGKKFPLRSGAYNTVVSNCVLEHVKYLDKNLNEINRVLKDDGVFITTVMTDKWEDYLLGAKILGNYYKKWMRNKQFHLNLLPHSQWDEIFIKTGFEVQQKVGYLSKNESLFLDLAHYLSTPSLISREILGKWVIFPQKINYFPIGKYASKLLANLTPVERSAALFYVLCKK